MKSFIRLSFLLILVFGLGFGVYQYRLMTEDIVDSNIIPNEDNQIDTPDKEPEPEPLPEPTYVTFGAVGDNIFHNTVVADGKKSDGSYDFTHMYEDIKPLIESVDIAFINQESPISSAHEPSHYPTFNSPTELAGNIVDAGFDIINLANNHSMDKGESGVRHTIQLMDTFENITHIGMYESQERRDEHKIIEKNGISIGLLTYTFSTNGIPVPSDAPYLVPLIDEEEITKDMEEIRPLCDALVVSMHWGNEYQLEQNQSQEDAAKLLNSLGADVIIGHHAHVIQPMETIVGEDGHETLVYYSLGNFLSSQDKPARMLGAFAEFTIKKDSDGVISIEEEKAIPIVTHFTSSYSDYTVMPLSDYNNDLAKTHFVRKYGDVTYEYFDELFKDVFAEKITTS